MNILESPSARLVLLAVVLAATVLAALALRRRDSRVRDVADGDVLAEGDLGHPLGRQATLVQVSARVCGQCATLRRAVRTVTQDRPDVVHVEVLAEERLDLVRRLGVTRTPTLFVLDAAGRVRARSGGVWTAAQIEQAVEAA